MFSSQIKVLEWKPSERMINNIPCIFEKMSDILVPSTMELFLLEKNKVLAPGQNFEIKRTTQNKSSHKNTFRPGPGTNKCEVEPYVVAWNVEIIMPLLTT